MRKINFLFFVTIILFAAAGFAENHDVYGPTTKADQLWQIAILKRPSANVSVQQTMLAILRFNPDAFRNNNVNGLKPGYKLNIPSVDLIEKIPMGAAEQEIKQQDIDWHNMNSKPKKQHNGYSPIAVKTLIQRQRENIDQLATLEYKFNTEGRALMNFDQQYQTRFAAVEQANAYSQAWIKQLNIQIQVLNTQIQELQNQIQQLNQRLSQQIAELQNKIIKLSKKSMLKIYVQKTLQYLESIFGKTGVKAILTMTGFFLFLLIIWGITSATRKKKSSRVEEQPDTESESDYDFLGSKEGIPAKLDLARAYIDMGDREAARKELIEILEKGNPQQQETARQLLCELH